MGYLKPATGRGRKRKHYQASNCAEAMAVILALQVSDLRVPGKCTKLPFPGMGDPGDRPGGEINFMGTLELVDLLEAWESLGPSEHCLLTAPKGSGKSCLLRALACTLFCTWSGTKNKLVCVWNLDAYRADVLRAVKEALVFTYCMNPEQIEVVERMECFKDVEAFLTSEQSRGYSFSFLVDSAQALDLVTALGQQRSTNTDAWIASRPHFMALLKTRTVLWGVSPRAQAVTESRIKTSLNVYVVDRGYSQEVYESYTSRSVLSHLSCRQKDIDYYAGTHPLFLDVLDECCQQVLKNLIGTGETLSLREQAECLKDDADWNAVILAFVNHRELTSIWANFSVLAKLQTWTLPCHSFESMMEKDPRYVYHPENGPSRYCSRFVERRYIEEFRKLEGPSRNAPWVTYCSEVLVEPLQRPNWSEAGWMIERLGAEVIPSKGIRISAALDMSSFTRFYFTTPGMGAPDIGNAFYYCPLVSNYANIDGVIVWRDLTQKLHFLALQFTVNVDAHLHSAPAFMNLAVVGEWIPDVLQKVTTGEWTLHYVFLGLESRATKPVEKEVMVMQGVAVGTAPYHLHFVSLKDAPHNRIGNDALNVLNRMMNERAPYEVTLPPPEPLPGAAPVGSRTPVRVSRSAAKKYGRAALEVMAKSAGVADPSRRKYRNMDMLLDALVEEKVFVIL